MFNYIKVLLDLEDDENLIITGFRIEENKKIISAEYKLITVFCSECGAKMHVKEGWIRTVKHNILQDGYQLIIEYYQRTWKCPKCSNKYTPSVSFVERNKQYSNTTKILAIQKLANLSLPVKAVADDFSITDTPLHNLFLQHVDMKRLPLPSVISIDEVYTNFRNDCLYSLVIMDFFTHEIIDILPSRREEYTNKYFLSIPIEERNNVEFVISDMYDPYLHYMDRYFLNAQTAIDSFHVIAWLINCYTESSTHHLLTQKRKLKYIKRYDICRHRLHFSYPFSVNRFIMLLIYFRKDKKREEADYSLVSDANLQFFSLGSSMMNKPITMLQSFQFLIKHIFNSHLINFNNPLSTDEFQFLETYCLNHLDQSYFHTHEKNQCKSPNLKYILSYERNYITFQNNTVTESIISIPVVYCESCNHYHAILPYLFISPRCQYSIPFILCVIFDKKYSNLTVEEISEKYAICIATIYRWLIRYSHYLNYYNQLKNKYHMSFFVTLLYLYEDILNDIFDKCAYAFFQHDCKLFTPSKTVVTSITSIK